MPTTSLQDFQNPARNYKKICNILEKSYKKSRSPIQVLTEKILLDFCKKSNTLTIPPLSQTNYEGSFQPTVLNYSNGNDFQSKSQVSLDFS